MHQLVNKTQIVGETCWIRFSLIADNQQKSPSWTEQVLKKRGHKVFYYSISFLWHFTYSSFVSQMNASFSKGPDYLWRWQRLLQKFKNPPDIYKYPLKFWQSCVLFPWKSTISEEEWFFTKFPSDFYSMYFSSMCQSRLFKGISFGRYRASKSFMSTEHLP